MICASPRNTPVAVPSATGVFHYILVPIRCLMSGRKVRFGASLLIRVEHRILNIEDEK